MPPVALPNLYATPADLVDYLGVEGVDLRLDDHNLASDQTVTVTADAAAGATSLAVTALTQPLLKGTVLRFDGGGTAEVVEVTLTATATVGAVALTVAALAAAVSQYAAAFDSGVNLATAARLAKACRIGTSEVKLYCCARYDDSALATCWSANKWATYRGARWLCSRRGNSPPKSVQQDADDALEEMRRVQAGQLQLEDIGTRTAAWPFVSNLTVDLGYTYRKLRVQESISEMTPTQYPQAVDWNSVLFLEL